MQNKNHNNPFKPLLIAGTLLVLAAFVFDPILRGLLMPNGASAVGGYSASDLLGQIDGADTPYYTSSGANNAPNARGFNSVNDVALDTTHHRLFVSDNSNSRILVFALDGSNNLVDRVADFVLGQPDFKTNTYSATQSTLYTPAAIAYDATGDRLFVADTPNNRIMVFDVATIVNGENAVSVLGQTDFVTTGFDVTQNTLYSPQGLAYDVSGSRLFVSDFGNNRIMVFDVASITNGENAVSVLGQTNFTTGTNGTTQGTLYQPAGLAYDVSGNRLFVADSLNSRVMVFDVAAITNGENAVNELGQAVEGSCPGPGSFTVAVPLTLQCGLSTPTGVAFDASGSRLFVADQGNHRVMIFDVAAITDGENAVSVLGQTDFTTATGGTVQSKLYQPTGLAYDTTGSKLFVADSLNSRIMVFDVAAITDGENAVNLLGQLDETDSPVYSAGGADNTPNAQGFYQPTHIVVDTINHRMFMADVSNNRVLVFNLDTSNALINHTADFVLGQPDFKTNTSGGTTQSTLYQPYGLAYDAAGSRLFVSDSFNNRVMVFDVASITDGENAVSVLGQTDFVTSPSGVTQNTLYSPQGLAFDASGSRLFVADQGNHRVMVFDVAAITNGENAVNELGQTNFLTGTFGTTQGKFYSLNGVTFDASGNRLFVADTNNSRVMVFDVAAITNGENAVNELGQTNFTTGTNGTTQSTFYNPAGLAFDATGDRLFVADTNNNRVMVFDVATITDGENATDVYGQTDFVTGAGGITQSTLYSPTALAYDASGDRLFVADTGIHRIMIFGGGATPTPTPTATPVGGSIHEDIGFLPDRIVINDDESSTDSKNVLVNIHAHYNANFTGTVDVLLSNTPDFSTTIPFRYTVGYPAPDNWPKTVSWDLCFGLPRSTPCNPGQKNVYARFYVNTVPPQPAYTPLPTNNYY